MKIILNFITLNMKIILNILTAMLQLLFLFILLFLLAHDHITFVDFCSNNDGDISSDDIASSQPQPQPQPQPQHNELERWNELRHRNAESLATLERDRFLTNIQIRAHSGTSGYPRWEALSVRITNEINRLTRFQHRIDRRIRAIRRRLNR